MFLSDDVLWCYFVTEQFFLIVKYNTVLISRVQVFIAKTQQALKFFFKNFIFFFLFFKKECKKINHEQLGKMRSCVIRRC